MLPQAASIQIVYCRTLCKPRGSSSFALQYGNYAAFTLMKELTDLGFHSLGPHRDRVSKFLDTRRRRMGVGDLSHAAHHFGSDASLTRSATDSCCDRCSQSSDQ